MSSVLDAMTRRFNVGDYGGGDEPAAKGASLSWRDDPDETLSDWRIEVNVPDAARNSKTYHVHKVVIAGGPRKSDYFVRQCRGNGASRLAEAARGESKLDLDAEAAEAMPAFLDYVYTGELQATKENACALFHLAEYTANPSLHAEVKLYLEESLDYTCAPTYIAHAHLFSQDKLIDAAVEAAAEQLQLYADHVFLPGDNRFDPATADNFSGCPELHDLFALHHTLFARVVTSDHRPEQSCETGVGILSKRRARTGKKRCCRWHRRRSGGGRSRLRRRKLQRHARERRRPRSAQLRRLHHRPRRCLPCRSGPDCPQMCSSSFWATCCCSRAARTLSTSPLTLRVRHTFVSAYGVSVAVSANAEGHFAHESDSDGSDERLDPCIMYTAVWLCAASRARLISINH